MENETGPNTVPCGTPIVTSNEDGEQLSSVTHRIFLLYFFGQMLVKSKIKPVLSIVLAGTIS